MQAGKNAVASAKAGMEKAQATLDGKVYIYMFVSLSFSFTWKNIIFNCNNGINDMWLCMHADGKHESP
jgi:hypothetical protein